MNFDRFRRGKTSEQPAETEAEEKPVELVSGITNTEILEDGRGVIYLSGKIDASNYQEVQDRAMEFIRQDEVKDLVFDTDAVTYVSSAGLRMFSVIHREATSAGKSYKLIKMRGDILKLFQMTGYASAFSIEMKEEI